MVIQMKHLAIIPARSGSKGLKDKNIKLLGGKPLLAHTIEAAVKSCCFTEVMVSTDKEEYADIARNYGAEIPFLRNPENSADNSSSWDVVKEVLFKYRSLGKEFEVVTLLQPTSPLRRAEDIKNAYELFCTHSAKGVVSVCEAEHSPVLSNVLPENNSLEGFLRPELSVGRQQLPVYYRINGAIYIARITKDLDFNLYQKNCYAYVMPQECSIDIDTALDFTIAQCLLEERENI